MNWDLNTDDSQNTSYLDQLQVQQQAVILQINPQMHHQNQLIMPIQICYSAYVLQNFKKSLKIIRQINSSNNPKSITECDDKQQQNLKTIMMYIDDQQKFKENKVCFLRALSCNNQPLFNQIQIQQLLDQLQIKQLEKKYENQCQIQLKYLIINESQQQIKILKQSFQRVCFFSIEQAKKNLLMIKCPFQFMKIFKQTQEILKQIITNKSSQVLNCIFDIYCSYSQLYQSSTGRKIQKIDYKKFEQLIIDALNKIHFRIIPSQNFYGMNLQKGILINVFKIVKKFYQICIDNQVTQTNVQKISNASIVFLCVVILHQIMHYVIRCLKFKISLDDSFSFSFQRAQKKDKPITFRHYLQKQLEGKQDKQFQKYCQISTNLVQLVQKYYRNINQIKQIQNFLKRKMGAGQTMIFAIVLKYVKKQIHNDLCQKNINSTALDLLQNLQNQYGRILQFLVKKLKQNKILTKMIEQQKKFKIFHNQKLETCLKIVIINFIKLNILTFLSERFQQFQQFCKINQKNLIKTKEELHLQKSTRVQFDEIIDQINIQISEIIEDKNQKLQYQEKITNQINDVGNLIKKKFHFILGYFEKQRFKMANYLLRIEELYKFFKHIQKKSQIKSIIPPVLRYKKLQLGYILQKQLFRQFSKMEGSQKCITAKDYGELMKLRKKHNYKQINIGTKLADAKSNIDVINMARSSVTKSLPQQALSIRMRTRDCRDWNGL